MCLLAVIALLRAFAAGTGATDLETLRKSFLQKSSAASAPEIERYHTSLSKLENDLVETKNYAAAIHVQQERLRIASKLESVRASSASAPVTSNSGTAQSDTTVISLDVAAAKTGGGVELEAPGGTLVGWEAPGGYAEWELPEHHLAGGYEIGISYASAPPSSATVEISEKFYTLTREVPTTGSSTEFSDYVFGTLRMNPGPGRFRISSKTVPATAGFSLKAVWLIHSKP